MQIVDSNIEKYLGDLYGPRHQVLAKMEAEARERDFPIVGPLVGKLLYQLARMVNARRIFEMGSGFGYSAFAALRHAAYIYVIIERYWWALAAEGGEIHCTEGSEANREKGETYLREAGLQHRVKYHVGNALEIIDQVEGDFDIIFIDIDKQGYPAALDKAVPRIREGGLLVADNVLWSGKVTEKKADISTEAIKEFNRRLFTRTDFAASIVPVRDGVAVAYKI